MCTANTTSGSQDHAVGAHGRTGEHGARLSRLSRAPTVTRARRHHHLCNWHSLGRDDRQEPRPIATQRVVGACITASDDAALRHVRLANGAAHRDALEGLLARLGARATHAVATETQAAELVDGEPFGAPADKGDLGDEAQQPRRRLG
eukprot:scaffold9348_cov74-Phaeocystis_antarctica.AAC.4